MFSLNEKCILGLSPLVARNSKLNELKTTSLVKNIINKKTLLKS